MNTTIPDKLYFKIGEVAKLAEVPTHVLRYWETEFAGIKPKRANSKQRLYRKSDVELILRIKVLLHEQGYTIAGARKFIDGGQELERTVESSKLLPPEKVVSKLTAIKHELQDLQSLLKKQQ